MTAASYVRERLRGWYSRANARYLFRRPFVIRSETPLISFTFDDFPRSALLIGGAILEKFGLRGTYYASLGLMGSKASAGQMFVRDDLETLINDRHELGCHTFAHCDSWDTEPAAFERSIIENGLALKSIAPEISLRTLSYPINPPRPRTKQKVAEHFVCSRGGGQSFNAGTTDLNYLSAYFLEKSRDDFRAVKDIIDRNRVDRGWLIFATHDVCDTPSAFGCLPRFFADVVQCAVDSGARILPVIEAWEKLRS